jgi:hypothetical protein
MNVDVYLEDSVRRIFISFHSLSHEYTKAKKPEIKKKNGIKDSMKDPMSAAVKGRANVSKHNTSRTAMRTRIPIALPILLVLLTNAANSSR